MPFLKLATGLILCVMATAIFGGEPVNVLTAEANDSGREDDRAANTAEEPITLRNVDQVEMLSEMSRPVNRVERGPGPNELVFHFDDGIEIVDDKTLKVVRRVADKYRPGFSYSRDGSKTSLARGNESGHSRREVRGDHDVRGR